MWSSEQHCVRAVAALCFIVLPGVAFGQRGAGEPIKTTVCELVKDPAKFDGKMVEVSALYFFSGSLSEPGCRHTCLKIPERPNYVSDMIGYEYAFIKDRKELKHPERLKWTPYSQPRPVTVVTDGSVESFKRLIQEYYWDFPKQESPCATPWTCPKYNVTATFVGRFDYNEPRLRAIRRTSSPEQVWATSSGYCSHGILDTQLVVRSVSDVVAVPIDRSFYDKGK
jgi:hypothetical protein